MHASRHTVMFQQVSSGVVNSNSSSSSDDPPPSKSQQPKTKHASKGIKKSKESDKLLKLAKSHPKKWKELALLREVLKGKKWDVKYHNYLYR